MTDYVLSDSVNIAAVGALIAAASKRGASSIDWCDDKTPAHIRTAVVKKLIGLGYAVRVKEKRDMRNEPYGEYYTISW
jgi:hypothetical protein